MAGFFSSVFGNGDDNGVEGPSPQEATIVDLDGNPANPDESGNTDAQARDFDSDGGTKIEDPGLEPVTGIIAPVDPVVEDGSGEELMG